MSDRRGGGGEGGRLRVREPLLQALVVVDHRRRVGQLVDRLLWTERRAVRKQLVEIFRSC